MARKLTAKPEAKAKRGRPSKFGTLDPEQVRKLAIAGWTDKQMSEFFGVDERTWNRWKESSPEFCQSLNEWKIEADAKVERSLYERALGYDHPEDKIFNADGVPLIVPTIKHYPPDTTACIFWLKNRKPAEWRDRQEHEHTGKDGGPMEVRVTVVNKPNES